MKNKLGNSRVSCLSLDYKNLGKGRENCIKRFCKSYVEFPRAQYATPTKR